MPTASSSIPLRNTEGVECCQSNLYDRKLSSGNYPVLNRFMYKDLKELGVWNKNTVDLIQANQGSISRLDEFIKKYPELYKDFTGDWKRLNEAKRLYKTMWELPQSLFIKMAAERGRYICQSQSINLYFDYPTLSKLYKAQFYGMELGLKTMVYYVRQQASYDPIKISLSNRVLEFAKKTCDGDVCLSCQ